MPNIIQSNSFHVRLRTSGPVSYTHLLGNMLMGMTVVGSILIFMTSVLSEMMRIAMFLGLSSTLLIGNSFGYVKNSGNKQIIRAVELLQVCLLYTSILFLYPLLCSST